MRITLSCLGLVVGAAFATHAVAQDIGVAACDNFIKTYETCVATKMPAAQQGPVKQQIEAMKANFRNVAQTPDGKKQLETVCKQSADQLKQQAAALNCAW